MPGPTTVWLKGFGGDLVDDIQPTVIKTKDGGFIVRMQTNSTIASGNIDSFCPYNGARKIFLKYNADATVLEWSKCFQINGDTFLLYPNPTYDTGFIIGGLYGPGGGGFYICKQDKYGGIVWSHGYSKGNSMNPQEMIACEDGGYIMMGTSHYTDTNIAIHYGSWMDPDIFVMKVDSLGNKIWAKVIGGMASDYGYSIIAAPGNGCYIVGATNSNDLDCTGNHGGHDDAYVVRLDKDGNTLWHRDLGGSRDDAANRCVANGNGGVIFAGSTNSLDGDVSHPIDTLGSFWVVNLDSSGNTLWDKSYGGKYSYPNSICRAANGDLWIAGVSKAKYGDIDTNYWGDDAWFVHTDNSGTIINTKILGTTSDDRATMVYPLSNGNVIAGGFYGRSDGVFTSLPFYGYLDAFLTVLKPYPTGIQQVIATGHDCNIFPNPVFNEENIKVAAQGNHDIIIYNMLGSLVLKASFTDVLQISVSNWAKGIYCVQVNDENHTTIQKLIIE